MFTFFSSLNKIANINMNMIVVDLLIVYLIKKIVNGVNEVQIATYSDTVISSRPQLEKLMSIPLKTPVGATCTMCSFQPRIILALVCLRLNMLRIKHANKNLTAMCISTVRRGKWKLLKSKCKS